MKPPARIGSGDLQEQLCEVLPSTCLRAQRHAASLLHTGILRPVYVLAEEGVLWGIYELHTSLPSHTIVERGGPAPLADTARVVFRARGFDTRTTLAIKALKPEHRDDHEAQARFIRDSEAIRSMRHENVVRIRAAAHPDQPPRRHAGLRGAGASGRRGTPPVGRPPRRRPGRPRAARALEDEEPDPGERLRLDDA